MKTNPDDTLQIIYDIDGHVTNIGLTKREYFAAMAMQGFLANERHLEWGPRRQLAETSVDMADYLITALNETSTTN